MNPLRRDLCGATVKLVSGETVTIPHYAKRARGLVIVDYVFDNEIIFDTLNPFLVDSIKTVLKFPNRERNLGRDLRGAKVELANGNKILLTYPCHRWHDGKCVTYQSQSPIFPSVIDGESRSGMRIIRVIRHNI